MADRETWAGHVRARSGWAKTWATVVVVGLLGTLLGSLVSTPAFAAGTIAVSTTAYNAATPTLGSPVTYVSRTTVSGATVTSKITVTQTTPIGVTPLAAFANGFVCGAPSGRTIACTTTGSSFAAGSNSPDITFIAIVTGSISAATIRSSSSTTATATGSTSGSDTSMGTGTLPAAPTGVAVSPGSGPLSGGNTVTVTGTNIITATAVEIGTTAEMQAGTPVTLLDCGTATTNCFDVSGSNLIVYMPARSNPATVSVTVVTRGVSGADNYSYAGPPATPDAPTATAGITQATVSWVAPATNGSAITGYVVTPYKAGVAQTAITYNSTATTQTLTGLTAGSSYTFTVAAVSAVGNSATSAQSAAVTPYALASAPTIGTATAGDSQVTLTWTAPTSTNGSAITGYVVTPYIGTTAQPTQTFNSTATTQTVTGLTPGTAYTFTVAAVNAAGTGPASAQSAAATPNPSPTLTFTAPPDGRIGVAYSNQLTVTGGTAPFVWSVSSGTLPTGITLSASGLLSGTPTTAGTFTFVVKVVDASAQSATKSVTITITGAPSTPAAPTLTVSGTTATATWVAPAANGSPITGYSIRVYKDGVLQATVAAGTATTFTSSGLTAGSTYTVTVAAVNAIGTGAYSDASNAVVAYAVASAPTIGTATAGDSQVILTWTAPSSANGSAVTGYVVTPYIGTTAQPTQTFNSTATTQTITGLTPGTAYTFTVAAVNAAGTGPASAKSAAATPNASPTLTFPNPPDGQIGVAYSNQLTVTGGTSPFTWTAPSGALPTGLTLGVSTGLLSGTPTALGTFTFTVQVVDASNQSSTKSVTITVTDRPSTPAAPTATAGVTSATVSWVAPANNGSAITSYVVTPYLAGVAQSGVVYDASATTRTLTGLTAGGSYTFTVTAVNGTGTSAESAQSSAVTPYALASAPTIGTATAGDSQVTLTWTAPTSANGSPVTGYVVTPYIGTTAQTAVIFNSTATTQTLTGLTAGTAYTFTVAAVNAAGTGPASAKSAAATPNPSPTLTFPNPPDGRIGVAYSNQLTVTGGTSPFIWSVNSGTLPTGITLSTSGLLSGTPTAIGTFTFVVKVVDANNQSATKSVTITVTDRPSTPAAPTATAGITSATVTWVAPANNGSAITSYVVTPYIGATAQTAQTFNSTATTQTVTGLPPGTAYTFTVAAVNGTGTSAESAQSSAVTPYAVASAPTIGTATAGDSQVTLTWTAPSSANGSPVTGYVVTPYIGTTAQPTQTFNSTATTQTITGLTAGTAYTFTVAAVNAAGTGPASAQSPAATPNASPTLTFPNPPDGRVGVAYSNQLTVTGGTSPFTWTVNSGTLPTGITLSTSGLLSGTPTAIGTFTFVVKVVDANNQSATKSVSLVVINKPAAPATPTATAGVTSATVSWVAPANNGGALTGYLVTPYLAGTAQTPVTYDASATTQTLTGLTAGGSYTFTVAAVNAAGTGAASGQSAAVVPYAVANAPTIGTAIPGDSQVTLSWTAPTNANGSPITGYVVTPYVGATAQTSVTFNSSATTQTITGLSPTNTYTFTVAAVNAAGTGPASAKSAAATPNPSPTLTFADPPAGEVGASYSNQLTVTGGTSPFTWSISGGALPAGITLGASTGLLSGTPTASGTFSFTVRVSDASAQTATKTVSLVIAAAPTVTFSPTPGEVGVPFSQQPTVNGGTGPFAWAVSAGSLPAGVTINPSTGLVSGTPTASGTFTLTIAATDAFNQVASRTVSIVIAALPTITSANPPAGQVGVAYSTTFTTAGGTAPLVFSVAAGSLPPGLSLNTSTGVVSGTPTTVGSSSFTVAVTDANNKTATKAVTLVVTAGPLVISKTANVSSVTAGGRVTYTITATNTGTSTFSGVALSDPLTGVLDDAVYNSDVTATAGSVSYASSTISWTGDLAAGAAATITYSVTVSNPVTGNQVLANTVTSPTLGTNCASSGPDSRCTATVTVSGLRIVKTANVATTTPGGRVTFTIVVTNTGQTAYSGATFTDSLTDVVDDATYNVDATATSGGVSYANSALTWTGDLAVGASATITYTATVANPDPGNKTLTGTVVSSSAGSTCPSGNPAASCTATVTVLVPALVISNTTNVSTVTPGGRVPYTITFANTGQTAYTGTTVTLAFAAALDDATSDNNFVASTGALTFNTTTNAFLWTGNIAIGQVVTITGSVTVRDPDPGNKSVVTVASSAAAGSTCRSGSTSTACTTTVQVLVPQLTLAKASNGSTTTPGSVVRYTVTATNSGQTDYTAATFTDALAGVLDDATFNNDAVATTGGVSFTSPNLTWTGDLAIGATVTVNYSVTVRQPDPGNLSLTSAVTSTSPGNTCPAGGTDARCSNTVTVLIPGLVLTSSASVSTTTPGGVVRYTLNVANTGQTTYTGATVLFDPRQVFDDATYNSDATSSTGSFTAQANGTVLWTLTLAPGESASGTMSVTVNNPDVGDRSLTTTLSSDAAGSTCPTGSANAACRTSVSVLIPGLTITKTANTATIVTGGTVSYSISVANTGQTSYPDASFTDSLSRVLSDATYNGNATADIGTVTFASPTLSWAGALAPGATATITYSVTVLDPDPGDKLLTNTVVSNAEGSNCLAGSTDRRCTANVNVLVPGLTIAKTADRATTVRDGVVSYTVTVTNSGSTAYTGATFTDSLTGVLDDAVYNANATASSGAVNASGSTITWTGNLAVGAAATITYSVTVNHEDVGNDLLTNAVTSTSRGSNCVPGGSDTRCTVTVPVARLIITEVYDEATAIPGQVLHAHGSFVNTGQVAYTDIIVSLPGDDVKDDVLANGDQTVSSGTLVLTPTSFYWTGSIAIGQTITGAGTVTVQDPDPGNKIITSTAVSTAVGNNCLAGSTDPRCTPVVRVLIPQLSITKSASTTTAMPGDTVGYTILINNSGQTPYTNASVRDLLSGVLDEADYNADVTATVGSVSYASPTLTWTGNLAVGQTATISYSVTLHTSGQNDRSLVNTVTSDEVGNTCPPATGNPACRSSVEILTPALTIVKTASRRSATLGIGVTYTVTVTNSGQTAYSAAAFSDTLAGVLDDATFNSTGTTATTGTATYANGVLSWSGPLAVGASATISYRVTVNNPATGDRLLANTVVSSNLGANCLSGSTDGRCSVNVVVNNTVTLTLTKRATVLTTVGGAVVSYTDSLVNSGDTAVTAANFTDQLAGVRDDATYNGDAVASAGTITSTSPDLVWQGTVPAGTTVRVTYSVTVNTAITGDQILSGSLTSTSMMTSNNCIAGSSDSRCTSTVPIARLDLLQQAAETTATPGSTIHVTARYTNTGKVPYEGISVVSPRADTSDDTSPTGDQTASSGTLVRTGNDLTWTGDIPVGGVVTITRTLTVNNPDTGNHRVTATLSSTAPGNNCASGTTDPRCTFLVTVLTPGLTITKKANTPYMVPGSSTQYTITIKNTGETPYTGASIDDNLAGLLDDATYNNDATSTLGGTTYSSPSLFWTGDLSVGATATIAYSVTALMTSRGDKTTVNAVTSDATGNNCPPASGDPACRTTGIILTPALTLTSSTNVATSVPGATVIYTIVARNTGQTYYPSATFSIPLGGVLDDASTPTDTSATSGSAGVNGSTLSWTGALAPGAAATITYSVRVNDPDTGNHQLDQSVTSTTQGSTCGPAGSTPACTTSVPIASLRITTSANVPTTQPNGVVRYTGTFTNTGAVPYVGISITDSFVGALDDASYGGDAAATSGTLVAAVGSGKIIWTGDLPVGGVVTITGSVTVNNPDLGDKVLRTVITTQAVGSNCPVGGSDPVCEAVVASLTPALVISNVPSTTATGPGTVVGYTLTIRNTGETAYTAARVTNSLVGLLDDGEFNNDAAATSGTVTFSSPVLTWVGDLAVNQTVVVTYSVAVDIPDFGDKAMVDQLRSDELGSNCPTGTSDPGCSTLVTVLIPDITLSVVADRATTIPGARVGYTVTISNTGQTDAPGASVDVLLGGALDDATYGGDAAATAGGVSFTTPNLTWTGDLPVGATVTVTYTLTVAQPDPGDLVLTTTLDSHIPGNRCSTGGGPGGPGDPGAGGPGGGDPGPGGGDPGPGGGDAPDQDASCTSTVTVLIPALAVHTTVNTATALPGGPVQFTLTIRNTGQTAYSGAVVSTSLTDVLDDADFGSATSTTGAVAYNASTLTWTGDLAVGASTTVTYTVTVRNPDPGNKLLSATAVSTEAGSTCPAGSTNSLCTATVRVLIPHLTLTQSANTATTTPGGTVRYTITVVNDGESSYAQARATDSLMDVLADANYNGDASVVGGGTVTYSGTTLSWVGTLAVGATATITYSVTVRNPDTGDKLLSNRVTSTSAGSTCPAAGPAAACSTSVQVLVPALSISKTANTSVVAAGSDVNYTITLTNTGETAYAPATFTDALTGVLDDATYSGNAVATSGTLQYTNDTLAWSGPLAVGASATITYSVAVRFPAVGDRTLTNAVLSNSAGSTCTDGATARCRTSVAVVVPQLSLSKTADVSRIVAGGTLTYTIVASNTGESDYPAAALTDSLAQVLDEGRYNGDATASTGTVSYANQTLSWTGPLTRGSTVVVTFSIAVNPDVTGDASLDNQVESTTVGSTCPPASPDPVCVATTAVEASVLTVTGLSPSITLNGLPGSTVTQQHAVSMTVTTNNPGGYLVTVRATDDALRPAGGTSDSIPIGLVGVRGNGQTLFSPLSVTQPVTVGRSDTATGSGGDAVSNDYQVQVPDVASGTYSGTLEYVVTAQ